MLANLHSQIFVTTVQKLVLKKRQGYIEDSLYSSSYFVMNAWEREKLFPREIPLNRILI
jgi:hypothetical protein